MTGIKTDGNASERQIKMEQHVFDALLIMRDTLRNLEGPSEIRTFLSLIELLTYDGPSRFRHVSRIISNALNTCCSILI